MFSNRKYLVFLLAVALCSSCVDEDLSDCLQEEPEPPVEETRTLKAEFVLEESDIDLSDERFECATLYVFDKTGALIDTMEMDAPVVFDKVFDTGWTLDPAEYEFVAWVNCVEPYSLSDCTNRANGNMVLDVPADGYLMTVLPWLLYGDKDYTVLDTDDEQVVVIPIVLENYVLNLSVTGITDNGDEYEFEISGGNNSFDFENEPNGTGFSYRVPAKFVNGVLTGQFNTIGFGNVPAYLRIIDKTTGKEIWPGNSGDDGNIVNIVDQSGQGGGKSHDLDIGLNLIPTDPTDPTDPDEEGEPTELSLATVTVNGWSSDEQDYEVKPRR